MASPQVIMAAASAGLELVGGLLGYFTSKDSARVAASRGRMLRMEAEADATRYAEQAKSFQATQRVAYLKSGVALTGSPLDVLDADALTIQENLSAMRARARAAEFEGQAEATQLRMAGRSALISGVTGGLAKIGNSFYQSQKTTGLGSSVDNNTKVGGDVNRGGTGK